MDLRQIQYFISLYEEQSVTRAAKRLNIVQPALSIQIAKLEQDIGRQLFSRTPRGMIPTPAAEEMYALFTPILTEFSKARAQVMQTGVDDDLSGHVRLGMIASIGQSVLPNALLSFMACHPRVSLSITEGLTDTLCDGVVRGTLDLAFANKPSSLRSLATELVLEEEILVAIPTSMIGMGTEEMGLERILKHQFILPTRGHGLRHLIDEALASHNATIVPTLELDSFASKALLIHQSDFMAFFPESIVNQLRRQLQVPLHTRRLVSPQITREIVYAHNPRRPLRPAAKQFATVLARAIREDQVTQAALLANQRQVRVA